MIAKFVKAGAISMLTIGAVLVLHSAAWCETCSTASVQASISCSATGDQCSGTSEAGKPVPQGVCTTAAKAGGDSACHCSDAKGGILSKARHSLAFKSKSGGAGVIALSTFLVLVGLWCLMALWAQRKTPAA